MPIEDAHVAQVLQVTFDTDPATALLLEEEQVGLNGAPVSLCTDSGSWCAME